MPGVLPGVLAHVSSPLPALPHDARQMYQLFVAHHYALNALRIIRQPSMFQPHTHPSALTTDTEDGHLADPAELSCSRFMALRRMFSTYCVYFWANSDTVSPESSSKCLTEPTSPNRVLSAV